MLWFFLFLFGAVMGSFLNVVASRYDGDHFLFDTKMIGGRSHCNHCGETLRWFELIPFISFIIQGGRCRRCKAKLSWQYFIVEILSALIFLFVPLHFGVGIGAGAATIGVIWGISALWIAAFEALLVLSIIDVRLGIIPDEVNIFLAIVGIALAALSWNYFGMANQSALGVYAGLFGWQNDLVLNRTLAAIGVAAFFGLLIVITRGRGMGIGDLKLGIPLGLLFGWPDAFALLMVAFVSGAIVGLLSVARRKNTLNGTLPFGPFLAIGAATVFFIGAGAFHWYFASIGLQ